MFEKENGLLYIKKRSVQEIFTFVIFFFPFIMAFLLEFLKLPSFVKYVTDVMYVGGVLLAASGRSAFIRKKHAPFVLFTVALLIYTFVVYLFNFQTPLYYFWGVRNTFRFYAAFMLFAVMLDEEDAQGCLKFMDTVFWINAAVSLFQFFVMGLRQDFLGGIFGVDEGCNSYTIIFFSIVLTKSLLGFMNKQEKAWHCFLKCGVSLLIAAMAELKFFFILFVLILLLCTLMTKFSFRKTLVLAVGALLLMFSGSLLPMIFGKNQALTLDNIQKMITATNYSTAKDLGRFTAIPTIARDFLTTPLKQLFGLGLGNCDTSAFQMFNSEFYRSHSYLNYNWFSSAFLFLETGAVGLVAYLSFFVLCFVLARRQIKKGANELFCRISMIMSVICFILVFYNSSLRTEIAYMAFFSLALPFVSPIEDSEEESDYDSNLISDKEGTI